MGNPATDDGMEEIEGRQAPSGSFQMLQELKKDFKDPQNFSGMMDLIGSPDIIPTPGGLFEQTLKECTQPFAKKSLRLAFKNTSMGRQFTRVLKTDAFENKFLKGKIKINVQNIVNGFTFYKLSQDPAVVSRIQEIYNNPMDWEKRYLTLNYFMALKARSNEKMQGMSQKAMNLVEKYEKTGGVGAANKVRNNMKKSFQGTRSKAVTTNFILFLHAALPVAYGNISTHFEYQLLFTYRDFIRSLRSIVDMIVEHADQLLQHESEGVDSRLEAKKERLIEEAKGGKKYENLRLNEMEKINATLQAEREGMASQLDGMIKRVNKVKTQALYLKGIESNLILPKKPRSIIDEALVLPREIFKELEKVPNNDLDAKAQSYIENLCVSIIRCSGIVLLHESFKKLLEQVAGKYGQVWPLLYATMMLDVQNLSNTKSSYEAKKVFSSPDQSTQELMADKKQLSQGCNQLLQQLNTIEAQTNASEEFQKAKVEFFLDKALLLRKLVIEIYPLLGVSSEVKIKHVEKGVAAVKNAEKAITKAMESDGSYEAKISETGRNELISSLYSLSSLMILEDDDDD
ncbi:MAG: hypothetical protein HQM13_13160 [SAR324 cluster bacterium]|nr:hypothetical protein [SAR324 cluster bacterium]